MIMTIGIWVDKWKEEKYLRHYTIVHVLRTINWRWFEQANRKIPFVTTCKKKKERDLWFRMFRLCHRMRSRAPRCIEFVRRHSLTSPAIWLTLPLSLSRSFLFFFYPLLFSFDLAQSVNITQILRRREKKSTRDFIYNEKYRKTE